MLKRKRLPLIMRSSDDDRENYKFQRVRSQTKIKGCLFDFIIKFTFRHDVLEKME